MFKDKPQAYLALPQHDAASKDLASQIRDVLEGEGIETFQPAELTVGSSWSDQTQGAIPSSPISWA